MPAEPRPRKDHVRELRVLAVAPVDPAVQKTRRRRAALALALLALASLVLALVRPWHTTPPTPFVVTAPGHGSDDPTDLSPLDAPAQGLP